MSTEKRKEWVLKLLLLGDMAVGKTSLINQYIEHKFEENYQPTLGVNIITKSIDLADVNMKVRLIIWDIAGQEKYNVSRSAFFEGATGVLLVYDISRAETFQNIQSKWLDDYQKFRSKDIGKYILIGNKLDLKDVSPNVISKGQGEALAKKINASDFIETSAKNGDNVEEAFVKMVKHVLKGYGEVI